MRVRSFLDALLRGSKLESRMNAEMRFHVESLRDDLIGQGVPPEEAARRARMEFGGLDASKEQCREARGLRWPAEIGQDLRYGLRSIRKNPGFAVVTILTLALGIGANTAIFSVLQAVILRPLPYPDSSRLVIIREQDDQGRDFSVTWPDFVDWRDQSHSFTAMSALVGTGLELTGVARPAVLSVARVSASYFDLLGVKPEIGRIFTADDDRPGAAPVVVLGDALWRSSFGSDSSIGGKTVVLSGTRYSVVGVAAPHWGAFEAYLPIGLGAADPSFNNRTAHGSMRVLAHIKAGTMIAGARADLDTIMARLAKQFPDGNAGHRSNINLFQDKVTGRIRPVFYVLLAAVCLVLLIACVNVANLLLARAADRRKEFAVRVSIGASRARIVRQMMTESLLLAIVGGVCGLALSSAVLHPLIHFAPQNIPRLDTVRIDLGVLCFSLAISLATGILFGVAPAFQASRSDVNEALKDGGRSATGGRKRQRMRAGLLIAELTFATSLLTVSMLLIRSLGAALATDPGFHPDHLVALNLALLNPKYRERATVTQFLSEATEAIHATPGVQSVGAAACPPFAADCGDYWYEIPGRTHFTPGNADDSLLNTVDRGYFPTIRATIVEGRNFNASDTAGSPPVVIIDQTLARKWWPRDNPVGSRIKIGGPGEKGPLYTIVGVVRDVNRDGLDSPSESEIFRAASQASDGSLVLLVRSTLDPSQVASAAERAIHSVDKDLPVRISTVTETMAESLATRRFLTALLAAFGVLALALAGVGIFGVIAYQAAQQTHEIGIRKALGAETGDIIALFSQRAVLLVMAGMVLGLCGFLASSRLLSGFLFGVKPWDPVTLLLTPALLAVLGLLASYFPARRAARLDAMAALRRD